MVLFLCCCYFRDEKLFTISVNKTIVVLPGQGLALCFCELKKNACNPHQFQYLNGSQKFFKTIQMSWMVVKDHSWPSISESGWLLKVFFSDHPTNIINFYIFTKGLSRPFSMLTDVDHKHFGIHLLLYENGTELWSNPRELLGCILSYQKTFSKKKKKFKTRWNVRTDWHSFHYLYMLPTSGGSWKSKCKDRLNRLKNSAQSA